jgi:hypothetical protein
VTRAALVVAAAALAATAGRARPAWAEGFERVSEGAPLYVSTRPVALLGALQKLGVTELPAVQRLRKSTGGIDPLNPLILAAPGIDVAAPLVASVLEPAGPGLRHTRVVGLVRDRDTFNTFVFGVIASGQLKLTATKDIKEGMAAGTPSPDLTVLVRRSGDEAILDVVEAQ